MAGALRALGADDTADEVDEGRAALPLGGWARFRRPQGCGYEFHASDEAGLALLETAAEALEALGGLEGGPRAPRGCLHRARERVLALRCAVEEAAREPQATAPTLRAREEPATEDRAALRVKVDVTAKRLTVNGTPHDCSSWEARWDDLVALALARAAEPGDGPNDGAIKLAESAKSAKSAKNARNRLCKKLGELDLRLADVVENTTHLRWRLRVVPTVIGKPRARPAKAKSRGEPGVSLGRAGSPRRR